MGDFVIYLGIKYYWNGRYYQAHQQDGSEMLHRAIWIHERGEIPKNHAIHHIDGDVKNNLIDNLTMKRCSTHVRDHKLEEWEKRRENYVPVARLCVSCAKPFLVDFCHLYARYCSPRCSSNDFHFKNKEHYAELAREYYKNPVNIERRKRLAKARYQRRKELAGLNPSSSS